MYEPTLFRDRTRLAQLVAVGVVPALAGAIAGVLVGVSSGAYWAYAVLVAIGVIVAGFEHRNGWGGAGRGFVAGLTYGIALLLVHAIIGTHAKVSLGSPPASLALVTAIAGALLSALGGRVSRWQRERRTLPG
ncbi:MAG: hypothetical protein WB507_07985 [Solirubrobacterales bacterium]